MRGELYQVDGEAADVASASGTIRVALVEDHAMLRRSLRQVIDREEDMQVTLEANDLNAAARDLRTERTDVLVLDARVSTGSGLDRIPQLHRLAPGMQIVIITMHVNRTLADQALKAGAIGFVLKDTADAELCDAIRNAARGVQYRSPRVSDR